MYRIIFQTLLAAASMAGIVSMSNVSSVAIQPQSAPLFPAQSLRNYIYNNNQVTTSNSTHQAQSTK